MFICDLVTHKLDFIERLLYFRLSPKTLCRTTSKRLTMGGLFEVDKRIYSGYFYPIQICRDVKKAGHVDPLSLDIECVTTLCVRYATTEPGTSWNIMDVIKPYRRFSPRRLLYIASTTLPAEPLQPVISCGRDPPARQTHYG